MLFSALLRRTAAVMAGAAGLVLAAALPASAHVTVSSPDAAPGGFGKLVFRVPNESASASTTRLVVQLPSDTPFASVSTKPVPGWTVQAEPTKLPQPVDVNGATVTEAVTEITWTAEPGGGLPPDQFTEFEVSVGTFPENVDQLSFPTIQTYSDGEVARWVQPVKPGAPEPEHPAPVLDLTAAASGSHHETDGASADIAATSQVTDDGDPVARGLGGLAVLLAAAALGGSVVAARRARG